MRIHRIPTLAVTLVALLAGCDASRPTAGVNAAANASNCTACHGGQDNETGAPPYDTKGQMDSPAVGAHTQHLSAGVTCNSCHIVPTSMNSPGHLQAGNSKVTFGSAATQNGAAPTYDYASHSCSSTYCHGGTLTGGAKPTVGWSDIGKVDCSSCHSSQQIGDQTATGGHIIAVHINLGCATCHGDGYPTNTNPGHVTGAALSTHVNGTVDVPGAITYFGYDKTTRTCASACHVAASHRWK